MLYKRLIIVVVIVVLLGITSVMVARAQDPGGQCNHRGWHWGQGMMGQDCPDGIGPSNGHHGMMNGGHSGMMGNGMMNGRRSGMMMGNEMMNHETMLNTVATALNLEPVALEEALQSGKTLTEIATEQGIEPQALVDAIIALRQEHMNLMVEQGYMTQVQADEMIAYMTENLAEHLDLMFTDAGYGQMMAGEGCPFHTPTDN